jgi:hypothetical protein
MPLEAGPLVRQSAALNMPLSYCICDSDVSAIRHRRDDVVEAQMLSSIIRLILVSQALLSLGLAE